VVVFEGIRCYQTHDGRSAIFRLRAHIDRLFDSAHIGELQIPYSKNEIADACKEDAAAPNQLKEGLHSSPGFCRRRRGWSNHPGKNPIRVAIIVCPGDPISGEEALEKKVRTKVSSYNRHHVNVMMTKAKNSAGNYVNSVLAKREVVRWVMTRAIMAGGYRTVCV